MTIYNKRCEFCGKDFAVDARHKEKRFCSRRCGSKNTVTNQREKRLQQWLEIGVLNYGKNTMIKVNSVYREYIANEQQHCCAICGIPDVWDNKPLVFVLDHIDGNSSNHNRNNLRLVCPNCDSQLDTYKFKGGHRSQRDYRIYKDK